MDDLNQIDSWLRLVPLRLVVRGPRAKGNPQREPVRALWCEGLGNLGVCSLGGG